MVKRRVVKKHKAAKKSRKFMALALVILALAGVLAASVYTLRLDSIVRERFEGKRFAVPARVYARPLELYPGLKLDPAEMDSELALLRYRKTPTARKPGTYHWDGQSLDLVTRPFVFTDGPQAATSLRVVFSGNQVKGIKGRDQNEPLSIVRLDPPLIGGIYPDKNEDRVLVRLSDAPRHLIDALIAVEDQRFYSHHGIDFKGIARAIVVTASGDGLQGGSTLTQQLVKNFFLTPERTIQRKLTEMVMAVLLEMHYDKSDILETYLNEVYLGQDGERAIHGFGLAASYYFDRPLNQLNVSEAALLVGMLKGPTYYNPRRNPERALERRNFVLEQMAREGFLGEQQLDSAKAAPLGVTSDPPRGTSPYPAFLELVYRQLIRDYRDQDLRSEGLRIITTLDPRVQGAAENALKEQLKSLEKTRGVKQGVLEGAVVITSAQNAEVQALVGGRNPRFKGFNRVLDALRPIGSLIKPVVYLSALQDPQNYTLATLLDDSPLVLRQAGAEEWSPQNYDHRFHGRVPLIDSLAQSYNVSTVRLGMAVGVSKVMANLHRLGVSRELPEHASNLLGAVALSPLEVAQVYQTMASAGFRTPLRAIRAVLTSQGKPLQRYPLKVEEESGAGSLFLLTTAMQEVVRRGTARSLVNYLPRSLGIAGKTGTTDGYRDSWFAGFTGDRLAVVWVGRDDNEPTGLSGASGAMVVWGKAMAKLDLAPLEPAQPDNVDWAWVEAASGLLSAEGCKGAVRLPFIVGSAPSQRAQCGRESLGEAIKNWFERVFSK